MKKPTIIVADSDYVRLTQIATAALDKLPAIAEELLVELRRADVRSDNLLPPDTVRMGSTVTFETDEGASRTVTLVYPGNADISDGRISILTPVGTALLGLCTGQSIDWLTNDGRRLRLRVLAVRQPAEATAP